MSLAQVLVIEQPGITQPVNDETGRLQSLALCVVHHTHSVVASVQAGGKPTGGIPREMHPRSDDR